MRLSSYYAWRARHPALNSIAIALVLGLVIEILFKTVLHEVRFLRTAENWIFDASMNLAQRVEEAPIEAIPFGFVDIDDSTWADWDFPLITPRDRLADILESVAAARPAVMVLDLDLAWPDPTGANDRLVNFLRNYPADAPPLIVARSLVPPHAGTSGYPSIRPTYFDVVTADHPNIRWGTVQFSGDGDRVARRWRLYEPTCWKGTPNTVPSVELAAAAAVDARTEQSLADALRKLVPSNCEAAVDATAQIPGIGNGVVLSRSRSEQRIIYSIRWRAKEAFLGPWAVAKGRNERVPLVAVRPARAVLAAHAAGDAAAIFADRIVVVGSSFEQTGDYHLTPLGPMPGSMVLINAIHSLLQRGTPREPGLVAQILIGTGLVVANALVFCFLRLFLAVSIGLLLIMGLMIMTVGWLRAGVMIDLAVPSMGVLIHRFFVMSENGFELLRRQGLRALLREHHQPRKRKTANRTRLTLLLSIPIVLELLPSFAKAADRNPVQVGIIETYVPPKTRYELRRGPERRRGQIGMAAPIMEGDEISVLEPNARIELRLMTVNGPVIVSRNNSPYIVHVADPPHGFWSGLFDWFANAIEVEFTSQHEEDTFPAVGKGGSKFEASLLKRLQIIAVGRRSLALGWVGSSGEVRIEVSREDSQDAPVVGKATQPLWASPVVNFVAGRYRVTLTDADGRQIVGAIDVVDPATLPRPSDRDLSGTAPEELRGTVAAAWLASQANGEYRLESLQLVAPLSRSFQPAKILERALVEGQALPRYPK
ncbi:MAG: hypothetical protein QOI87_872 [Bradyrhizobium sp.]|jgi:CHASE2 domain-containing sensor protein|nr:hypothetical protein [Bradyrhizobium sp.]